MGAMLLGNPKIVEEIIENSGNVVFIKDRAGVYLLVNRKWEEVAGRSRGDALGKTDDMVFPPENARIFMESDRRVIETGTAVEAEVSLDTLKGTRYLISNKFPLVDAAGATLGLCGIATDITERKRVEDALRESEFFLRRSQSVAQIGSYCFDVNSGSWISSPALDCIFGIDGSFPKDVEGWIRLIHPEDREEMSRHLTEHVLREHHRFDKEYRIVRFDTGEVRWIHGLGELDFDKLGNAIRMIGTVQDITDRKQTERSLSESEYRFKALHNASFGGIAIHDKGIILECNKGLSELTGYAYDELIGMDGLLLISEDTRPLVVRNIQSGYEKPYEAVGVRKNGERYPIRLEARNVPYRGKSVRVVEFRDISEVKRAEQEKEDLEKKLVQAQKMEAIGRLAGGVAHDFNNMLSVIIGHAELGLLEVGPDGMLQSCLEEIRKAGHRSADLTRQLMAFARQQAVAPQVIDMDKTITGMLQMLQRLIGEDVELVWHPGRSVLQVKIDPSQVDQILTNLCVNARDSIAGVGRITIECDQAAFDEACCANHAGIIPGEFVCLSVSDSGCGMDAETLDHIFEPFFTTKESGKGTGLGLSTVYGVVRQNHGFINVYSEPGHGSTFKLYLPRHASSESVQPEQARKRAAQKQGQGTILLVEDEPGILSMISRMLAWFGYKVIPAAKPSEAIALARKHDGVIDLLMTDVVMPEMNGRSLAEQILSFRPSLKCLFVSGYTANVIASRGVLDAGVNFLQKPFCRDELGNKISEILGTSE